ncbi:MAG: hydantoinase/oxoprolinase family protein [Alphaproteobacteria bacterium]|nr:hydantoinase/oxoprolinase family protein [Alphaproteobacteria bacterium]
MGYKLGCDVGGTFTDVLLINSESGEFFTAKVPSTPEDSSKGVLNGIEKACQIANIDLTEIDQLMHGTTVATNAILTGKGAKVGLITTKGYRQMLQIARSFVPGGLGGWIFYQKSPPLAPLAATVEIMERIGAKGDIVMPLDEEAARQEIAKLQNQNIEAMTISLINSFANDVHEKRLREIVQDMMPSIPVSISSEVIPEMQEYERTITTVANSYVRPEVEKYISNLQTELDDKMGGANLSILRSDGGLSTAAAAAAYPVNLLMSGPAGGVSGAIWVGGQAGIENIITFDMGGTSTDVALVENGRALVRRETSVGDVTVRASSLDVRTVGAGGGSIAHVPELTGALRVGPESAGAAPGPAAYNKGGEAPTVTDANLVLGYLPESQLLGGDMKIRKDLAEQAVQKIADAMKLSLHEAAEGIIKIVNERMFGAVRLVSVEKGYDPRDFSLMAFGGAGPLHANALGELTQAWPVIVPPGPGILCAYGDATTRLRNEASKTLIVKMTECDPAAILGDLKELDKTARTAMLTTEAGRAHDFSDADLSSQFQIDVRYAGQGLVLTVPVDLADIEAGNFTAIGQSFDDLHEQLFTFRLSAEKEFVNLRSVVEGPSANIALSDDVAGASAKLEEAVLSDHKIFHNGAWHEAKIYDRKKLHTGHCVLGPAIITEMDSTTVILPNYKADVDNKSNLLLSPA